jgi:hypothetical protein
LFGRAIARRTRHREQNAGCEQRHAGGRSAPNEQHIGTEMKYSKIAVILSAIVVIAIGGIIFLYHTSEYRQDVMAKKAIDGKISKVVVSFRHMRYRKEIDPNIIKPLLDNLDYKRKHADGPPKEATFTFEIESDAGKSTLEIGTYGWQHKKFSKNGLSRKNKNEKLAEEIIDGLWDEAASSNRE